MLTTLLAVAVVVLLIVNVVIIAVLRLHLRRNAKLWRIQNKANQSQCSANHHVHKWQTAAAELLRRLANGERV